MEFVKFRNLFQEHAGQLMAGKSHLFVTDVDKDILWETYLNSFPKGTNEIFRERRDHDCSCCRHFIKSFGNVVSINDKNEIETIWNFKAASTYQPVIDALDKLIKRSKVVDVFITKEKGFGVAENFEKLENGNVRKWDHFHINIPKELVCRKPKTEGTIKGDYRDTKNVLKRSLEEVTQDSVETILDLINQKSLYKGEEWKSVLTKFSALHKKYQKVPKGKKENFCWRTSVEVGAVVGKIRNHSIGVLLTDISEGMDLNEAIIRYEKIVAPTNYKRPKAIYTKKMIEQAQKTLTDMGFIESLGRRFAKIEDITINNILFANRDVAKVISGKANDIFAEMKKEAVTTSPKKFDKVQEIPIEKFIADVLPNVKSVELFLENRHSPNFVSLIAPKNKDSKTMFKWDNNFSWAYKGNITDSLMKERVKSLGGNTKGVLRFSIQWNESQNNNNDFDAHCVEPNGNRIYFPTKGRIHPSSGSLDVDIIDPKRQLANGIAVENIIYTDLNKMPIGLYQFDVNVYSHRGGQSGFSAEIEFNGQIYSYEYRKPVKSKEFIPVATVKFNGNEFEIMKSLDSTVSSKEIWSLATNQLHPVTVCMFSPNYWDEQKGIGHKHYFFILKNCINEETPNGFFNEFLHQDLMEHKRVFEALGSKMNVEPSDDQLSGLGFSSTKSNSCICKLDGNFSRMVKLIF